MKVDFQAGMNVYRQNSSTTAKPVRTSEERGKTDVVDFSHTAPQTGDKATSALKTGVAHEISKGTSAQRIEDLRQRVQNGTYHVSTDELVDAILG